MGFDDAVDAFGRVFGGPGWENGGVTGGWFFGPFLQTFDIGGAEAGEGDGMDFAIQGFEVGGLRLPSDELGLELAVLGICPGFDSCLRGMREEALNR